MRRSRFIFLAPSFFLGLDGYSFCAYWYLLTARGRERAGEGQGTTRRGGAAGGWFPDRRASAFNNAAERDG